MHAMQGPFTLCLSVLVCGALLAQSEERQRKVDSLQQVLGSALHDTDSVSTLIAISSLVTGDERMGYARAALRIADRGLPGSKGERRGALLRGLGGACSGIGSRLRQLGQRDSAIFYYQRGLEAAREAEDPATEANLLNGLGVVLYQSGNIDSALVLMEKSLAIREATGDSATLAASCVNIASMHHARGNIPMALEMYVKARDLAERRKDMPAYATVLVNIGALHEGQHELDSALAYYRRALGPLKELNNTEGLALAHNNMGTVYLTLKEYDRALESVRNGIPPAVQGRHHNAPVRPLLQAKPDPGGTGRPERGHHRMRPLHPVRGLGFLPPWRGVWPHPAREDHPVDGGCTERAPVCAPLRGQSRRAR
ncbi:MAG: tetratricopeptide repeat protein [Flavobacteriales bacterium]|nr:tetratricopeptide repeat protein [Flavobacteriales bacterium]